MALQFVSRGCIFSCLSRSSLILLILPIKNSANSFAICSSELAVGIGLVLFMPVMFDTKLYNFWEYFPHPLIFLLSVAFFVAFSIDLYLEHSIFIACH